MNIGREPVSTPSASGPVPSLDREALALVQVALSAPHAATAGEAEKRARILADRMMLALDFLDKWLDPADTCPAEIQLRVFNEMLDSRPAVGYVTSAQADARLAAGATWSEAVRPVGTSHE